MSEAQISQDALTALPSQESLLSAMMRPDFYPKPPAEITHKETHISHLFFAGELVYKIKKAVRFSFLDYSTLARRRHFLQEELRLNRRLAPSVYLAVMPIAFDDSGWRLGGWGEPAEYTLVMRRLPDKRMLPFLLNIHQATPAMMEELADTLARFHAAAAPLKSFEPRRYLKAVADQWSENLAEIEPWVGDLIDRGDYEAIKRYGADFLRRHGDLLMERVDEGWIRDVHGDLHCEHICFAPEGIQIFDCIEFSAKLRRCDLAAEVAFLIMDLEVRGAADLAAHFLARYRGAMDDPGLPLLLPFGKCYRALVRAKVYALRGAVARAEALRYFRYAKWLVGRALPPSLVMICGLSGSGKSTLARALGERLGFAVISSDIVRKEIAGRPGRHNVAFEAGIYGSEMTDKTYAEMERAAARRLREGHGAILDASFIRRAHRRQFVKLADRHRVGLRVIHCTAPEAVTKERLDRRSAEGKDVSDGRWEIFLEQKKLFEPLVDIPSGSSITLDTDRPLPQLVGACEKFLHAGLRARPDLSSSSK